MAVMGTFVPGPYWWGRCPHQWWSQVGPKGGARPPCASLWHQPKGSWVNTKLDEKSYKGIAPIFTQGREPYPDPNVLIFDCKILIYLYLCNALIITEKSVSFAFVIVMS